MESFANVYASEMFIDDGRGIPLWHPEPELHIGDVGLFYNGGFVRLFNITVPAGHPYNSGRGVPPGFRPLRCNPKLWQTKDTPPGAFKTRDEIEATARDLGGGFFMGYVWKERASAYTCFTLFIAVYQGYSQGTYRLGNRMPERMGCLAYPEGLRQAGIPAL